MEGKLIIEIYEYSEDSSEVPTFEYIPCDLANGLRGKSVTLKDLILRGFEDMPRKEVNVDKRDDILRKLDDANIGRIEVAYRPEKNGNDACIELTNVVPVTLTFNDARYTRSKKDEIILKGRYKLSEGNEITTLRDAQRLTLVYSNVEDENWKNRDDDEDGFDESEKRKSIYLNITYLE